MEDVPVDFQKKLKSFSDVLLKLMKDLPTSTKKTTVYRGAEAMLPEWENLQKKDELLFTNKGMISFNKESALNFIEEQKNCCLLILHLPKNTHGLYLKSSSLFNSLDEDDPMEVNLLYQM
jgi:hypothetical protein